MVYLFENPKANSGKSPVTAENLAPFFPGEEVSVTFVTEVESYPTLLDAMADTDIVVLSGGDGTLHHFANGIRGYHLRQRVYFYKSGSGNDFLRDIAEAMEPGSPLVQINRYLQNLPVTTLDDGREYVFLNNTSLGVDGLICQMALDAQAKGKQKVDYTAAGIKALLYGYKRPSATVTVDGVTKTCKRVWLASAMNGRYVGGGMFLSPNQQRDSDKVTMVLLHRRTRLVTLLLFPKLFKGTHINARNFEMIEGHEITVTFDRPQIVQLDGEILGTSLSYTTRKNVAAPAEEKETTHAV